MTLQIGPVTGKRAREEEPGTTENGDGRVASISLSAINRSTDERIPKRRRVLFVKYDPRFEKIFAECEERIEDPILAKVEDANYFLQLTKTRKAALLNDPDRFRKSMQFLAKNAWLTAPDISVIFFKALCELGSVDLAEATSLYPSSKAPFWELMKKASETQKTIRSSAPFFKDLFETLKTGDPAQINAFIDAHLERLKKSDYLTAHVAAYLAWESGEVGIFAQEYLQIAEDLHGLIYESSPFYTPLYNLIEDTRESLQT